MLNELGLNEIQDGELGCLLWAPHHQSVRLHLLCPTDQTLPMQRIEGGYHTLTLPDPGGPVRYMFRFDDGTERPDPASRHQPEGVHGPSALLRHGGFKWSEKATGLPALKDYITYELHVGAFTPEGTFEAAARRIPYLRELGVNAIELMPVGQFPGSRNWGYDGVHPYAIQNTYGGPDELKSLINECHCSGIAVILDVVYNHLGPEGNYLAEFGPYFTDRYRTPWGDAVNFDGKGSGGVRRFFIENALYLAEHFRIDALRLDAVHGIFDMGATHFLKELAETLGSRTEGGKKVYLIAESDLNNPKLITPVAESGYGLDAQWSDDFHHAMHAILTGEQNGYYMDFGQVGQLTSSINDGFVYSGQYSKFRDRVHGAPSAGLPAQRFVVCCQNHDQIGNRLMGDRLAGRVPLRKLKLAAAWTILSPFLPLLFMGEEYGETAPFPYFISHTDPSLIQAVSEGRKWENNHFKWQGSPPDPQDESTFKNAKLDHGLKEKGQHKKLFEFYKHLIKLRKNHPVLREPDNSRLEVTEFPGDKAIAVRRWRGETQVLLAACFGGTRAELTLQLPPGDWKPLLDSSLPLESGGVSGASAIIDGRLGLRPVSLCLYELVTGRAG